MPELPEVETVKRILESNNLVGKKILSADVLWHKSVSPGNFSKAIKNKTIKAIGRRGKYLYFLLSNDYYIFFHLRMSGRIFYNTEKKVHDRVIINLSGNNHINFNDMRKFGRIKYTKYPLEVFNKLGPEPLDKEFNINYLRRKFSRTQKTIKSQLLDQSVIAGIGNIYADETLFFSGVHPIKKASLLNNEELRKICSGARKAIKKGINNGGTSLGKGQGNFFSPEEKSGGNQLTLNVYGRALKKCFNCGDLIRKIKVAGRGTHFCPTCQKI